MDLRKFVDDELLPAIYLDLDKVFPEMKFEKPSGSAKWRSPYNMDGTSPKHPRKDKTVVTEAHYQIVTENGGGGSKNIISFYMDKNNIGDRIEALRQISNTLGLLFPEGENAQKWEAIQKEREELALSFDRQRRALFDSSNPRAVELLRYLKEKRGYSEELIKSMGLGYITPEEAKYLQEKCNIKIQFNVTDFPLSVAYFSRGYVIGFKCRYITAEAQAKYGLQKYRNALPEWVEMNKNPFGILPNNLSHINKKEQVIVMEGELDALHATALGLPNVIATSGNKIVPEQAEAIRKNGYKNVVILLDADEAGQQFTGESIRNIDEAGLNSFTATIPGAKDTDEYLRSHTIEELKDIIENATFGGLFLYTQEKNKFQQKPTEAEFFKFLGEYIALASKYKEPYKREILFTYLRKDFPEYIDTIEKGIRESVEKRVKVAEEGEDTQTALGTLKEASASVIDGEGRKGTLESLESLQDALKVISKDEARIKALSTVKSLSTYVASKAGTGETIEDIGKLNKAIRTLKKANQEESFATVLKDNTEELYESYKDTPEALSTKFELYHQEGSFISTYKLSFPSGGISIIGAQTGHGKSKFLQSVALDAIGELRDGETILYVTYEENEQNVNIQFENAFFNDTLTEKYGKGSNLVTMREWLTKGETRYMRAEAQAEFFKKEEEWKGIRRSGKIRIIKPEDSYLETLVALIEYAVKHIKLKAIFIDYVQEIYVENWSQYSRTDELKKAMVDLDTIAQKTKLPIIMAAQLSREATSPLDLFNQYIADSGWIERKASEIILLWASNKEVRGKSPKEIDDKLKRISEEIPGFKVGKNETGKIYLKLTKSRVLPAGSSAIVDINGNTGRITQQLKEEPKPKPQQKEIAFNTAPAPGTEKVNDNNVEVDPEAQYPFRGEREEEESPDGLPF